MQMISLFSLTGSILELPHYMQEPTLARRKTSQKENRKPEKHRTCQAQPPPTLGKSPPEIRSRQARPKSGVREAFARVASQKLFMQLTITSHSRLVRAEEIAGAP